MAEDSGSGERTESPTAKRRSDFRKKGQVAQSREVQTAAMFTFLLLFWIFFAPYFWDSLQQLIVAIWKTCGQFAVNPLSLMQLSYHLGATLAKILAPLFAFALLIGFFSTFLQIGWLFSAEPMMPDLTKLDPIKGMARFFSKRSLLEVIKSLLKVILIGWIAFKTVADNFEQALILAVLGFLPGLASASAIYALLAHATDLPFGMDVGRSLTVFVGTLMACMLSGALAARRLRTIDPAELF